VTAAFKSLTKCQKLSTALLGKPSQLAGALYGHFDYLVNPEGITNSLTEKLDSLSASEVAGELYGHLATYSVLKA